MTFSIRARLIVFTCVVIAAVGGSIALHSIYRGRQGILAASEREAKETAELIAAGIVNELYALDLRKLRDELTIARTNPSVRYTYVADADGVLLTDGSQENPLRGRKFAELSGVDPRMLKIWKSRLKDETLDITGPLIMADGTLVGYLQVGFSLSSAYQAIHRSTLASLYITLIFLSIGSFLVARFSGRITRPILSVVQAANAIGEGRLDSRLSITRRDELGSLSSSINRMAESLEIRRNEIQRVQESLRVSEERFRQIAENIKEVFWVVDPIKNETLYVSPAYEEVWGRRRDKLRATAGSWLTAVHPDDMGRVLAAVVEKQAGGAYNEEYRIVRLDGSIRWINDRAYPVRDPQGKIYRMAGIAEDITDRKRAEEEIQRNLRRIRALHEIDLAISSTLDLESVLNVLLEKMDLFLPYAATTVRLFNPENGLLEPVACRNLDAQEWKVQEWRGGRGLANVVFKTNSPRVIRNAQVDPSVRDPEFYRKHRLVSYLGVPLIAKEKTLGVMGFYTKEEHEFTEQETEFLLTLAGQAAIGIHNAQLYKETERRRREAEELARVARSLTETLDIAVVGNRIVTSVRDLFGCQGSTLRLRQADGSFHRLALSGEGFSQTLPGDAVPPGAGLTGMAIAEGKPVWSPDALNDPRVALTDEMRAYQMHSGDRAMIAVPLRAHEKLIGALTLSDRTGRHYSQTEVTLLETFADQAALALENARLYEETHHSKKELETTNQYLERSLQQLGGLYAALTPITAAASTQEMMRGIIERLIDATGADAALIRVWDKKAGNLPIIGHRGFSDDYLKRVEKAPVGGAVEWVVNHREPIVAPSIVSEPRFKGKVQLQLGLQSCAMLPFIVHDEVRGIMHIASRKLGHFDEEQKDHLTAIARQMSIALENRELFDALRSSTDELGRANAALTESNRMLSALHAVAAAASQSLDLDRVLQAAIERITDIFGFQATQIHVCDEQADELRRRAAFERDSDHFASAGSFKKGQGVVGTVAESGTAMIFEDTETDPRYRQLSRSRVSGRFGYHFFAVFPLKSKLKIFGTLACTNIASRKLNSGEIQLLESLADQIAVAIENAELYDAVKKKVEELQQKTAELEQANRIKDEFLSVISHELRTPLNVIMGYTGVLQQGILGEVQPAQQDALKKIDKESRELLMIVDAILNTILLESQQAQVETREVSLRMLLEEVEAACAMPGHKNLELIWDYAADLPTIRTDSKKVKYILENLIHNAVKFTDQGQVTISARRCKHGIKALGNGQWALESSSRTSHRESVVSGVDGPVLSAVEGPQSFVEFRVADTGAGISCDVLPRIFDKFYQADSSATRDFGGMGLGLYIAKKFTDLLGGHIEAKSTPGKGSTFTVRIPANL